MTETDMNLFGWIAKECTLPPVQASCSMEGLSFTVSVCSSTGDSLVCTSPSCRIQANIMEMIGKPARICIDGTILEGALSYYTVEDFSFRIGFSVDRRFRGTLRRICAEMIARQGLASARQIPA